MPRLRSSATSVSLFWMHAVIKKVCPRFVMRVSLMSPPRSSHDVIFWYTKGARWHFDPPMVPATSQRMKGKLKKAPDVLDVPAINNMAKERTGYPTQKPLALLELLVRAHTQPGDWVCDPMCGSGTTGVAALRLGRNALLGDIGDAAIAVARARASEVVPGEAL